MKKILFAVFLVCLCASCQKDSEIVQKTTGNGFVSKLKVTATIDGTKVSYVEDNETHALQPSWEIGDKIIGFDNKGKTYCFEISGINDGRASLELITEGDDAGTAEEDPTDGTSMYMFYAPGAVKDSLHADKKEFTFSIKEQSADVIPALMKAQATVENESVTLHFTNETSIIAIKTPKMATADKNFTSISLFGTGVNTDVKFSVNDAGDLVAESAEPGRINKKINVSSDANGSIDDVIYMVSAPIGTATKLTFQADNGEYLIKDGQTLVKGYYYYMTAPTFNAIPTDVIPGGFSVKDADGVISTIFFSKGNLYATHNSSTNASYWGFEANQYDYRTYSGKPNCVDGVINKSGTGSAHWGLFGWPKNTNYGRYNKTTDSYYTGDFKEFGKIFGDDDSPWRTLTRYEWKWLIGPLTSKVHEMQCRQSSTVNNVINARFMKCTVGNTIGVLLFPDVFKWPEGDDAPTESLATEVNVHAAAFNSVTYTLKEFKKLESAGAVFLPAAGYRVGTNIYYDGGVSDKDEDRKNSAYGLYWSSTAVSSSDREGSDQTQVSDYSKKGWAMFFAPTGVGEGALYRYYGHFVRLVRMAE